MPPKKSTIMQTNTNTQPRAPRAAITATTYNELTADGAQWYEAQKRLTAAIRRKGYNPSHFALKYGGVPVKEGYNAMMKRTGGAFAVGVWIDCILAAGNQ